MARRAEVILTNADLQHRVGRPVVRTNWPRQPRSSRPRQRHDAPARGSPAATGSVPGRRPPRATKSSCGHCRRLVAAAPEPRVTPQMPAPTGVLAPSSAPAIAQAVHRDHVARSPCFHAGSPARLPGSARPRADSHFASGALRGGLSVVPAVSQHGIALIEDTSAAPLDPLNG